MKSLLTSLVLALFVSNIALAGNQIVDCKDRRGNVLPKTSDSLNQVRKSNANRPMVYVDGTITQILPEDKAGLPHQKYILSAFGSVKLVIVSNIDFGRIPVAVGSKVAVCGEYLNAEGGMVHWTHFDPHGGHPDGFTILDGKLYGDKEQTN
jgi:hypothetical protein